VRLGAPAGGPEGPPLQEVPSPCGRSCSSAGTSGACY